MPNAQSPHTPSPIPHIPSPLSLIFMGTPDFSVPCLQALIGSAHEVVAVYCQPPRPAGRGHKLRPSPVQALAEAHNIPVHYPTSLKGEDVQQQFREYKADAAIVAAYGLLLPKAILEACPMGCINVHPSALPRWRGAAPLQRTIMAGDTRTAMCIMQMDEGLDTGDILLEQPVDIADGMTAGQLHDMMASRAGEAVLDVLSGLREGSITPRRQSEDGVTYAAKISKQESQIDWNRPASEVRQHILGLSPYPAASFSYQGGKVKVYDATMAAGQGAPSTVLDDALTIACADGAVRLLTLQRPGKKPMPAQELLRGFEIKVGEMLG